MTSTQGLTEAQRARALRLRHVRERQAIIFGTLIAALLVVGLGAAAMYTGLIASPFHRPFSTPTASSDAVLPAPCLPAGTRPVAYKKVSVKVLNGSGEQGLAGKVATALEQRGFTVSGTGNYKASPLGATARVVTGTKGVAAAYTLAAQILDARIVLDGRTDAVVELIVGAKFDKLLDPSQVTLDPDKPMTSAPGCSTAAPPKTPTKPTATAPASPKAS